MEMAEPVGRGKRNSIPTSATELLPGLGQLASGAGGNISEGRVFHWKMLVQQNTTVPWENTDLKGNYRNVSLYIILLYYNI